MAGYSSFSKEQNKDNHEDFQTSGLCAKYLAFERARLGIEVLGPIAPAPIYDLTNSSLSPKVLACFKDQATGLLPPLMMQAATSALQGLDCCAVGGQYQGKTLTIALLACHHFYSHVKRFAPERDGPLVLLLCPDADRSDSLAKLLRKVADMRVTCAHAGRDFSPSIFDDTTEVLVGDPETISSTFPDLSLRWVTLFAFDDAHCFMEDTVRSWRSLVARTHKERQTLVFAAELTASAQVLADEVLTMPSTIRLVTPHLRVNPAICCEPEVVGSGKRLESALRHLNSSWSIDGNLVVCSSEDCKTLPGRMKRKGYNSQVLCSEAHARGFAAVETEKSPLFFTTPDNIRGLAMRRFGLVLLCTAPSSRALLTDCINAAGTGQKPGKVVILLKKDDDGFALDIASALFESGMEVPEKVQQMATRAKSKKDAPSATSLPRSSIGSNQLQNPPKTERTAEKDAEAAGNGKAAALQSLNSPVILQEHVEKVPQRKRPCLLREIMSSTQRLCQARLEAWTRMVLLHPPTIQRKHTLCCHIESQQVKQRPQQLSQAGGSTPRRSLRLSGREDGTAVDSVVEPSQVKQRPQQLSQAGGSTPRRSLRLSGREDGTAVDSVVEPSQVKQRPQQLSQAGGSTPRRSLRLSGREDGTAVDSVVEPSQGLRPGKLETKPAKGLEDVTPCMSPPAYKGSTDDLQVAILTGASNKVATKNDPLAWDPQQQFQVTGTFGRKHVLHLTTFANELAKNRYAEKEDFLVELTGSMDSFYIFGSKKVVGLVSPKLCAALDSALPTFAGNKNNSLEEWEHDLTKQGVVIKEVICIPSFRAVIDPAVAVAKADTRAVKVAAAKLGHASKS
ncbi:probable pre-mRNA-processing ATP-dependent RNA helicase prp5 at N-terminal half [Coccomyxa sp. Obi]|nr:probable pre-mRNA-processing ATP-dependent RNA helicase prp5 at N-terminal half [Coccomyxa sp. Obi]